MKTSILLLAFAALVFTSCSSAYKSGQTPDDVYYSEAPERKGSSYVEVEDREDRAYRHSEDYYETRYLRYRLHNRYAWSPLDDYYYNPSYAWHYGSYNSWYSPYSSYHCWNNYYNPYYGGVIVVRPIYNYRPQSRPIAFNPSSYNSNPGSKILSKNGSYNSNSRYNNSNDSRRYNNNNSVGNSVRRIFSSGNSGSNNNSGYSNPTNNTPSRSYNPSSSSSSSSRSSSSGSSSGGSRGGGGGVSRPAR